MAEVTRKILADVGLWLWRLVPANPIVLRVVSMGSKRASHFWARTGYLLVMLFVVLIVAQTVKHGESLGELAKSSASTFEAISVLQLAMMCFLAPVFTAGAISQEKDAETFNVLLTTPLTNAQIALGSLMSRLFFVLSLLLSGLPIFCITMLYGGVTTRQIFISFGIAACTALVTGALAITISMIRVGTRGTILSFYAGIAVYLFATLALGLWPRTHVPESILPGSRTGMSWLSAFNPFLALLVGLKRVPPPAPALVDHYGWALSWVASAPHMAYMAITFGASVVMIALATVFVRRGVKQAEGSLLQRAVLRVLRRKSTEGERRRRPRHVWANPVAWREAVTQGSAAGNRLVYYGFIFAGISAAVVLLVFHNSGRLANPGATAEQMANAARDWLTGIVMVEFVTAILMALNTGATAISRERESGTMELMLVTPLESDYIIRGKIRGLISFTAPLMAVPAGTVLLMAVNDLVQGSDPPVVNLMSAILLPALLLVYSALACVVSLQTSLKSKGSVQAIIQSMGIMTLVGFGLGVCAYGALETMEQIAGITGPLTFVMSIYMVLNPHQMTSDRYSRFGATEAEVMAYLFVGTVIAIFLYGGIVTGMYRSMVRNFDMIVRKQSK
ncbi:MAG TPA: ABC transporter permease subunit [Phycisphaerae bacterium]|nr:ABC transporter permease subunit [Phycisphaerae bacterium]HRR85799.1 ABC transporter permease subunit [Phycisphaerae bacterium]